jgi:hypothetical protein
MGEIIETISPGAHYGKSINREDAELAIMFAHGLANLISKRITG